MIRRLGLWGADRGERTQAVLWALESLDPQIQVLRLVENPREWEEEAEEETETAEAESLLAFRQRALPLCGYADFQEAEDSVIVVINGDLAQINHCFPGVSLRLLLEEPHTGQADPRVIWLASPEVDLTVTVLRPLMAMGLEQAAIVSLESVSQYGEKGVPEMIREIVSLLNGKGAVHSLASSQWAFNLLPVDTAAVLRSRRTILAHLDCAALQLELQRIQVPVFYGLQLQLFLAFKEGVSVARVQERLQHVGHRTTVVRVAAVGQDALGPVEILAADEDTDPGIFFDIQPGLRDNHMNIRVIVDNLRYSLALNLRQVLQNLHVEKAL